MAQTLQKNIRVTPEQWDRIETALENRGVTANQLLVELAMEALDRREWPHTELEIHLLRSCMFAAQAIARDMEAAGRGDGDRGNQAGYLGGRPRPVRRITGTGASHQS